MSFTVRHCMCVPLLLHDLDGKRNFDLGGYLCPGVCLSSFVQWSWRSFFGLQVIG
jgi:hypothetical protein